MGKISNMKIEYIDAAKKKTAILHYQKRNSIKEHTHLEISPLAMLGIMQFTCSFFKLLCKLKIN